MAEGRSYGKPRGTEGADGGRGAEERSYRNRGGPQAPTEVEGRRKELHKSRGGAMGDRGGHGLVEGPAEVEGPKEGDTETEGGGPRGNRGRPQDTDIRHRTSGLSSSISHTGRSVAAAACKFRTPHLVSASHLRATHRRSWNSAIGFLNAVLTYR